MYTLNFNHILYFITCNISYIQWLKPPMGYFYMKYVDFVTDTLYVLPLRLVRFSKWRSTGIRVSACSVTL